MAKLNEADLKRQIKNMDFKNFYLLYGEEKMLVSVYSKKLQEKANILARAVAKFDRLVICFSVAGTLISPTRPVY